MRRLGWKTIYRRMIDGTISPKKAEYKAKCGKEMCRVEVAWKKWNAGPTGEVYFPDGAQVTLDEGGRASDWALTSKRPVKTSIKQAEQALKSAMRQIAAEQTKKRRR